MLIKLGARLQDPFAVKRVRSRLSPRLWSVAAVAVLLLLGLAGTALLLMDGARGVTITNVLGLWIGVLSIVVPLWKARGGASSTESSPETASSPGQQEAAMGRTGSGGVVAITAVYGLLLAILLLLGLLRSVVSTTPAAPPTPTAPPATPSATPTGTAEPAVLLPLQLPSPTIAVPSGPQPIAGSIDPSRPGINPPADHRFGGPRPMNPPPPHGPPPEQADFVPTGIGLNCSPLTAPAVRIKAIAATDGLPGIATHNYINLEVLRANQPGYTYWIIAHLIGTNGDGSPYIAKQQVRNSVGTEIHDLQLDAAVNSVRDIYIVEADPDGTEKLRQNNQLPMDGSQDNQPVRVNPPPGQTVSATCRVTKTRD